MKLTIPMHGFLLRVARGEIRRYAGYTQSRGGYERFVGGEATAKKAAKLGLIQMPGVPSLGRPTYAVLTDAGPQSSGAIPMRTGPHVKWTLFIVPVAGAGAIVWEGVKGGAGALGKWAGWWQ